MVGLVSTHHKVHNAEYLVTFAALLLAPFAMAVVLQDGSVDRLDDGVRLRVMRPHGAGAL